jgi:hypothetical protein
VLKSCICSYPIKKYPLKGDTIQYSAQIHNTVALFVGHTYREQSLCLSTTKMVLDAAETVLGFFGFDRAAYSSSRREEEGNGMKN